MTDLPYLDIAEIEGPGIPEYHDALTITLMELIEDGVLTEDGDRWQGWDAYSAEQRARMWKKLRGRFDYREIGVLPVRRFLDRLFARMDEIMPKLKPLYQAIDEGQSLLTDRDEWHKSRAVFSTFPQTALGGSNEDYASSGTDREYETVKDYGLLEAQERINRYNDVDVMLLDAMELVFSALHTTTVAFW